MVWSFDNRNIVLIFPFVKSKLQATLWIEEVAQWIECLLCKHEDQHLDAQRQCKKPSVAAHVYSPRAGVTTGWPSSVVDFWVPMSMGNGISVDIQGWFWTPHVCMYVPTYLHASTHEHIHKKTTLSLGTYWQNIYLCLIWQCIKECAFNWNWLDIWTMYMYALAGRTT